MVYSPLEIFEVKRIIYLQFGDLDFSISTVPFLIICILFLNYIIFGLIQVIPEYNKITILTTTLIQYIIEMVFTFVKSFYKENLGFNSKFFVYIYFLFLLIAFSNLFGMIPFSFTVTSQLLVTFSCSLTAFIALNYIGFCKHGLVFFSMFLPTGVPLIIAPFLIPIEFISYNARVFSLAIRLFANMMSGHALLHILGGFCFVVFLYLGIGFFAGFLMSSFIMAVSILELAIAVLQAYVFTVLICIYLHDAIYLH